MQRFNNNKIVTIKDLEESGRYNVKLLQALRIGAFEQLYILLSSENRANIDIMEPILYAIKNEFGTYAVFTYYSDGLQKNHKLGKEIIAQEPELIKNTALSKDENFIRENAIGNPDIIQYMSPQLQANNELLTDLIKTGNEEVISEVTENCNVPKLIAMNPELRNDKEVMGNLIKEDANYLKFASNELKNDYQFLKGQSSEKTELIDYVVNNIKEFGLNGIKGVRESSRNFVMEDCMQIIDEMSKNSEDERYAKVKDKIQKEGTGDVHAVRWVTAMVAQNDNVSPEIVQKTLNYAILTMEKIKQDLTEDKQMKVNLDNVQELITPLILNRLVGRLEQQGINIDNSLQEKLDEYVEFYEKYHAQFNEQKKANMENNKKITTENIEEATKEVDLNSKRQASIAIQGEIQYQKER